MVPIARRFEHITRQGQNCGRHSRSVMLGEEYSRLSCCAVFLAHGNACCSGLNQSPTVRKVQNWILIAIWCAKSANASIWPSSGRWVHIPRRFNGTLQLLLFDAHHMNIAEAGGRAQPVPKMKVAQPYSSDNRPPSRICDAAEQSVKALCTEPSMQ